MLVDVVGGSLLLLRLATGEVKASQLVVLPASVLSAYWVVMGCWRRSVWGAPSQSRTTEAAAPLSDSQDRWLRQYSFIGALAVGALVVAILVQVALVRR